MPTHSEFRLDLSLPREQRYAVRGVPVIELWVSGPQPDCIFHRVAGICDSGASRTLLSKPTYERLGYKLPENPVWFPTNGLTRQIAYVRQPLQLRIAVRGYPLIHLVVVGGLTPDIEENLFGADLLEYFAILLTRDKVTFLGDRV